MSGFRGDLARSVLGQVGVDNDGLSGLEKQYDDAGLNAPHIVETVLKALRVNSAGVEEARA